MVTGGAACTVYAPAGHNNLPYVTGAALPVEKTTARRAECACPHVPPIPAEEQRRALKPRKALLTTITLTATTRHRV